jgi:hypothetical protein
MNDAILIACQQWQEGLIDMQEWQWKMMDAIQNVDQENLAGFASVITQYAIHLRGGH